MRQTRRFILQAGAMTMAVLPVQSLANPGAERVFGGETFRRAVQRAEADSKGRLGVAVLDTATGARFAWRGDERFPVCSTFKFLLTAAVLSKVDAGHDRLDRTVPITARDLVGNSPVSEKHVGPGGLSVAALCEAAMVWSDNAAANLLSPSVGGPAGVTAYARALGDAQTRLDRIEPDLGKTASGDPRDTTTPDAMLGNLQHVLLGRALTPVSKQRLTGWMMNARTGAHRLRAGLPGHWRAGDKTGSGDHGTTNDIAILWPPGRAPLLVTAYLTGAAGTAEQNQAVLAAVGRAVAAAV